MFNEIYTQIFEKCKLIKPYERPVLQLWSVLLRNGEKDIVNTFKHNAKTHSTMKEKKIIPLYAEHLYFLVTRADWLVTKSTTTIRLNSFVLKKNL